MPNWAQGSIRFRGKPENIKNFLENEILVEGVYIKNGKRENYEVKPEVDLNVDQGYCEISSPYNPSEHSDVKIIDQYYYINGSKRNFIGLWRNAYFVCSDMVYPYGENSPHNGEIVVLFEDFNAAWSVDGSFYTNLCVKYGIDIRILAWEQGMEFAQDDEITRDGRYIGRLPDVQDDWAWKAIHPGYGG